MTKIMDEQNQSNNLSNEGKKVTELLAKFLGVEPEDLNQTDSFTDILHMKPTDIADFLEIVKRNNLYLGDTDISEILLLSDLVEVVEANNLSE